MPSTAGFRIIGGLEMSRQLCLWDHLKTKEIQSPPVTRIKQVKKTKE